MPTPDDLMNMMNQTRDEDELSAVHDAECEAKAAELKQKLQEMTKDLCTAAKP